MPKSSSTVTTKRNALNSETVQRHYRCRNPNWPRMTIYVLSSCAQLARGRSQLGQIFRNYPGSIKQPRLTSLIICGARSRQSLICRVPVICRIQGACIGGAMEMAAACDLRIATSNATFCMPEVRVGIPSVIQAVLLPTPYGSRTCRMVGLIW